METASGALVRFGAEVVHIVSAGKHEQGRLGDFVVRLTAGSCIQLLLINNVTRKT
mgnify:CR=1 FL=1